MAAGENPPPKTKGFIMINTVKNAIDIVDVISEKVKLNDSNMGCCPFHSDKKPSMCVYPDTQRYYCFGCDATGDVIDFVQQTMDCSFPEALRGTSFSNNG